MARKKDFIKEIQRRLKLKSFEKAEEIYKTYNEISQEFLVKEGSLKVEGIGIIKIGEKKAREIKVPKLKEKVFVPNRKGLFFKPNKNFEQSLNK